jgi:hypothetical protein
MSPARRKMFMVADYVRLGVSLSSSAVWAEAAQEARLKLQTMATAVATISARRFVQRSALPSVSPRESRRTSGVSTDGRMR